MIVTTWKSIFVVWKYQIIIHLIDILLYKPDYYNLKVKSNLSMASKIFIIFSHNLFFTLSVKKWNKNKKLTNKLYMWRLIKNFNDLNYNSPELAFKVFKNPTKISNGFICALFHESFWNAQQTASVLWALQDIQSTLFLWFLCTLVHYCVLLPKASNYVLPSETHTTFHWLLHKWQMFNKHYLSSGKLKVKCLTSKWIKNILVVASFPVFF